MALKQSTSNNVLHLKDAQLETQQSSWRNVGTLERWISGIGGGALAAYGLWRRDWPGAGLAVLGGNLVFQGTSGHSFVYQALGVNTAGAASNGVTSVSHNEGVKVVHVVTIDKAPEELYRFWRNFENLPRFMEHLQSVTVKDSIHSHWVANAPAGMSAEWNAEIINDRPNQLIAWRSVGDSQIGNAGSVHFTPAPGNRGTEVKVVLEYDPPAGRIGSLIAKLFGEEPNQQVREDLRHFKEIMEAGEIPTTKGQPAAR
ncbi:MAG: SRPBCC family protein [Ktedonobacteraceae bacterium]